MGWFTRKSSVPNAQEYAKLHAEGVEAFHAGDLQRAIDLLLEAFKVIDSTLTNKTAEGWLYIGLAEMQLHYLNKKEHGLSNAEGALLTARALDYNNTYVIYNLGNCYLEQKRFSEAEKCYLDCVQLNPDADALLQLGHICHNTGRKVDAVNYWERVLAIDPANAAAKKNLDNAKRFY